MGIPHAGGFGDTITNNNCKSFEAHANFWCPLLLKRDLRNIN